MSPSAPQTQNKARSFRTNVLNFTLFTSKSQVQQGLTLEPFFRPELAQEIDETYELRIDDEVMQVRISGGAIEVWQGTAVNPDAIFYTDNATYPECVWIAGWLASCRKKKN